MDKVPLHKIEELLAVTLYIKQNKCLTREQRIFRKFTLQRRIV